MAQDGVVASLCYICGISTISTVMSLVRFPVTFTGRWDVLARDLRAWIAAQTVRVVRGW